MKLENYFANHEGIGVLATADRQGKVDAAIYARPQVLSDGTLALLMRDRLTHKNLTENPYATYLFIEKTAGYQGIRLFLKKLKEDTDAELTRRMTRPELSAAEDQAKGPKFVVYFQIEKVLSLIGGSELDFAD